MAYFAGHQASRLVHVRAALGVQHTYTMPSIHHLGVCLLQQDKCVEAESLLQEAVEPPMRSISIAKHCCSARRHKDMLATMGALAVLLCNDRGSYAEAQAPHQEALDGSRAVFGAHVAETLASIQSMAMFVFKAEVMALLSQFAIGHALGPPSQLFKLSQIRCVGTPMA
eukprot:360538-Chlamydomonas_euryale.AAC.2